MVNIRKITPEKEAFIKHSTRFGVPVSIIAEVCEVNPLTISKHTKSIRADLIKEFNNNELALEMLKLYAWSIIDPTEFTTALGYTEKMSRALHKYLKLDNWVAYSKGILNTTTVYKKMVFDDGISDSYKNLIYDTYYDYVKVEEEIEEVNNIEKYSFFKELLREMYISGKYPEVDHIRRPEKALQPFLEKVLKKNRMEIGHFIPKEFVEKVIEILPEILSEKEFYIINFYYGLKNEARETLEVIAEKLDTSKDMVRQYKEKVLRKLRKTSKVSALVNWSDATKFSLKQKDQIEQLEAEFLTTKRELEKFKEYGEILASDILNTREYRIIPEKTKAVLLSFRPDSFKNTESKFNGIMSNALSKTQLESLTTHIKDLSLSERPYNCLKAKGIKYLWQSINYDLIDLLKLRNFGKKSLSELEGIVRSKGFTFGMTFDDMTMEYLIEKTQK